MNDLCRPFRARRIVVLDPGAARSALAPGYLLPRLRRWLSSETGTCHAILKAAEIREAR